MTTNQAAPKIAVISPDSDPAEVIDTIIMLIQQLGTTMLSDVAVHTAQVDGTDPKEEYSKFSARVDAVSLKHMELAKELYKEDEMLGTMVLGALLHSVNLMRTFVSECNKLTEENQEDHDLGCLESGSITVPEGFSVMPNGSKNEH